ncbi:hypothetical protein [Paenibacillus elgii]|uniref:hypothetical protein n=1 Tax=Paenibacillus elgii TaxID=189691 RepID=UPI0002FA85C0|nr:hypothetical protein [Paenibacillus elgii]
MMSKVDQIRSEFMSRYGLTDDIIYKGTITTSGPTYISADPCHPSIVQPVYVEVASVDDFKEFGGHPDHLFASGDLEQYVPVPDEWPAERNDVPYNELTPYERAAICKAYTAYVFGYSPKVESYREVIQKHYFPAKLALFAGEDIVVEAGSPLNLVGSGDQPATYSYNSITVKAGGQINVTGQVTLLSNVLTQEAGDDPAYTLLQQGTDGQAGAAGSNGGSGSKGAAGSSGVDDKDSCSTKAGQGSKGSSGQSGGPGGNGSKGTDGSPITFTFDTVNGPIVVSSIGGEGGAGGNGGNGGSGGDGGDGGAATSYCSKGLQGDGGNGGDGGAGGEGGDGGNGGTINLSYTTLSEGGSFQFIPPTGKGQGGQGGKGGNGGTAGAGNQAGTPGKAGAVGANGVNGTLGNVYINNVPLPPSS